MAIQEIEVSSAQGTKGFAKKIDSGANRMVFDILQATQYQKPEESTVRELASNAVDSQREKTIAIDILQNGASPSKYFIQRDGDKYKDSNWDPSYYDLNYLDHENNHVEIEYVENEGLGFCDVLTIKDYGVGIGDSRIEGIISLGYSTKRNNKAVLGAWGLGAKVALSMRSDYYSIETVHNGRRFIFNCYAYKTDFAIGPFDLITGKNNNYIELSDGTKAYYEDTDEKNFTKVSVFCKRHHRSNIRSAVKSQLLYFNNVMFNYKYEDINTDEFESVDFLADVTYNSDNIIISDNNQFSKPHVIIVKGDDEFDTTGVCYGYIDFTQLEMENLRGNIGIKCPIRSTIRDEVSGEEKVLVDGVSVTPSRESVIWDDHTRKFLFKKLEAVVKEATELIAKELVEDDFLCWIDKCKSVLGSIDNSTTIGKMARLIDRSKLKPAFKTEPKLKYESINKVFWSYNLRIVSSYFDRNKKKTIVQREELKSWQRFKPDLLYYKTTPTSKYKDEYIIETMGPFTMIELEDIPKEFDVSELEDTDNISNNALINYKKSYVERRNLVLKYLKSSKLFKSYDDIVVPDDWKTNLDKRDEREKELSEYSELSPAELRKLENKIPIKFINYYHQNCYSKDYSTRLFHFRMTDSKIPELQQSENIIYYGHNLDDKKLCFAAHFLNKDKAAYGYMDWTTFEPNSNHENKHKFIKISNINKKYLHDFLHVDQFFEILIENTITMDIELINWHTARIIDENLNKLLMFRNFETFNSDCYDKYCKLIDFHKHYYASINWHTYSSYNMEDELMNYFNKSLNLQLFVRENNGDVDAISKKGLELFSINNLEDAKVVDIEIYDILQELLEYAEEVGPLLNNVSFLNSDSKYCNISNEQELLVKEILNAKRLEIS